MPREFYRELKTEEHSLYCLDLKERIEETLVYISSIVQNLLFSINMIQKNELTEAVKEIKRASNQLSQLAMNYTLICID